MCRRKLTPGFGAWLTEGTGALCVQAGGTGKMDVGCWAPGPRIPYQARATWPVLCASRGFRFPRLHGDVSADVLLSGGHGDKSSDRPVFNALAAVVDAAWS